MISLTMNKEYVRVDGELHVCLTLDNPREVGDALGEPIKSGEGALLTMEEYGRINKLSRELNMTEGETIAYLAMEGARNEYSVDSQ